MRKLIAVIRPHHAERLCLSLAEDERVEGLVAYEGLGGGRHWRKDDWRGMDLLPKAVVECLVEDEHVEALSEVLISTCRTGSIGDGKIFVLPVD